MEAVQARKQRMISGALTDQEVRTARIEELKMLFTWTGGSQSRHFLQLLVGLRVLLQVLFKSRSWIQQQNGSSSFGSKALRECMKLHSSPIGRSKHVEFGGDRIPLIWTDAKPEYTWCGAWRCLVTSDKLTYNHWNVFLADRDVI